MEWRVETVRGCGLCMCGFVSLSREKAPSSVRAQVPGCLSSRVNHTAAPFPTPIDRSQFQLSRSVGALMARLILRVFIDQMMICRKVDRMGESREIVLEPCRGSRAYGGGSFLGSC